MVKGHTSVTTPVVAAHPSDTHTSGQVGPTVYLEVPERYSLTDKRRGEIV